MKNKMLGLRTRAGECQSCWGPPPARPLVPRLAGYSLNGQEATGDFTVVFHADTSEVGSHGPDIPAYVGLTGTITLSGVGVGTFGSAYVFNHQVNEAVGFGVDIFASDIFDLIATGVGLSTHGLTTDFGPISTSFIVALDQWIDLRTTLGALSVFSVREGTFQATLDATPVPESGTLALLGLGLLGLGVMRRRAT